MAKKGGAPTKSEILATISKDTELSRKQVNEVFDSLNGIVKKSLRGMLMRAVAGVDDRDRQMPRQEMRRA